MHLRIERHRDDRQLRVLPEIPPLDQCLLEGENGIGKTLAVHLLELAAGQQPYLPLGAALWRSLRAALGPTTLTLERLAGDQRLRVEFEPDGWPVDVATPPGAWLGRFELDGQSVPAEEAFALLSVVRLDGTETPDVTVRRSMSATSSRVERVRSAVEDRLEAVREALGDASAVLHGLEAEAPARVDAARLEAEGHVLSAESAAEHSQQELAALDDAVRAQAALDANETERPVLLARQAALERSLREAREEQERVEQQAERVRAALAERGAAEKRLAYADDALQKRRRRLETREERALVALRDARLAEDAVSAELERVRVESAQLRLQRDDLDNDRRLERLVQDVAAAVELARGDGVDEAHVLARTPRLEVTVGELAAGLRVRASELVQRPVPATVAEIDRRLGELAARRTEVERVSSALGDRDRARELVDEQVEEVARLRVELGGPAGDELERVVGELSAASAIVADITRQLVEVQAQLSDRARLSERDARQAIARAADSIHEGETLGDARQRAAQRAEQESASLGQARQRLGEAQHESRVVGLSIERAARRLREHARLVELVGGDLPTAQGQRTAVLRLAGAVATVDDRIDRARNAVDALKTCADDLARGAVPKGRLGAPFMAAVGERLRRDLDGGAVRDALFDGQPVERIDLVSRVLNWTDRAGVPRERPLAAFSTGEQAFAFTQARIRQLEPADEPNRLVVLDEFGAFVSAERMRLLAEFLREPDVRARAPQVLVILPLQVDYAREIGETTGALRERYEDRVAQLAQRQYFTADLAELT